ncbi:hypothetical protein CPLU01_01933 [Colletotrichum plurivorum]|uniref:Aminoglycoside phosphotransferase domain-containing protein n=1 Tax=Colletotrichum plurivorum TaxID=2175906 RepID=A0A8H6NNG2_9PEZI|nr:hypothetical protein CPLU01_01933 [Colletotrichum plurivorum]
MMEAAEYSGTLEAKRDEGRVLAVVEWLIILFRHTSSSSKPHNKAPIQLPNATSIHELAARLLSSPCFFILTTEIKSYSGGEYLVYPLESICGRRICIRIPKETHQHTGFQLEREADIRRRIDAAGIDLFQPLIAADPTADNSLHVPFMALGWADGKTASDWIKAKINRKIVRAKAGTLPGGTVAECHIIDLGWAELVPLQFAAVFPRFLTHEPAQNHGIDWTARDTKQMEQDRAFYLECIRTKTTREGGIFLDYLRVISRQNEASRYWWFTAASRIDIHRAVASCGWDPPIGRNKSMN